jgi:hypothetical protein
MKILIFTKNYYYLDFSWVNLMKNDECTINIMKGEKCVNKFRKVKEGWSLTISTGRVFPCSCEQMVSHLLPALAFGKEKGLEVRVVPDKELPVQITSRDTDNKL